MSKPTRILIVEDLVSDFELAQLEIRKSVEDCIFKLVDTRPSFLEALETFQPDVILSDYSLPSFDGMTALKLAKKQMPLTPFIIWTGSMSEDVAVECMRAGANNYILKENLKRLGTAIVHAINERELLLERKQSEEKLRLSEARFVTIFENSPVAIGISRLNDGKIIHANAAFLNLYGFSREEVIGHTTAELEIWAHPEDRQHFIDQLRTQKHMRDFEAITRLRSGSERYVIVSGELIHIDGEPCLMAQILDISERKLAEQKVRESEERFRALIENSLDNISLLAPDGTLLWENPAVNRTLGYKTDEFVSRNIFELMHPDDIGWTANLFAKVTKEPGSQQHGTFRLMHQDGTWRWIEATATNMLNDPSVQAVVINYRDATERKQAEIEVQQRNEDLHLINVINEAANRGEDLNGIIKLLSKELKRIFSSSGSTLYMLSPDGASLTMQQYLLPLEIQHQVERLIGSTIPLVHIPLREDGFFKKVLNTGVGFITSNRGEIEQWMAEFVETPFLPTAAKGMIRKLIPQIYDVLNIRSAIVIPLLLDGKAIGILDVSSSGLFTENDLKRIVNISGQLTAAIQHQQANDQVHRSQEFLQSVQNALSASIAILDETGVIVQVNSAWRKFGEQNGLQHPEYCIGLNYLEICDSATGANTEEAPLVAKAIRDVISGQRREVEVEYPCHSPEEKRWFNLRVTKFDDGEHLWVVLAHEDITEHKLSKEALQASEERYRLISENSTDVIWTLDLATQRFTYVSPSVMRLRGLTPQEVMAEPLQAAMTPESYQFVVTNLPARIQAFLTGDESALSYVTEIEQTRKDGSIVPTEVVTTILTNAHGAPVEILGVTRDITERKRTEEALHRAEKQLELFFSQSLDGFFFMMLDEPVRWDNSVDKEKTLDHVFEHQHITRINKAMLEQYGASEEQFLRKTPNEFFAHDLAQGHQTWRQLFDDGHLHIETDERRFDGTPIWLEGDYICIYEEDGRIAGHFGIQRDVTERKLAEKAVLESEKRYRALFEDMPVAVWEDDLSEVKKYLESLKEQGISDLRTYFESHPEELLLSRRLTKILDVNKAALEMYGADSKQELIDITLAELGPGELEHWVDDLAAIASGKTSYNWEGGDLKMDDTPIEIILNWTVVPGHEQDYSKVVFTTINVTERKQMEAKLRSSETRYRLATLATKDVIWEWNPDDNRLTWTENAQVAFGYSPEEVGPEDSWWDDHLHPEDRQRVLSGINTAMAGTVTFWAVEYRFLLKDGSYAYVSDHCYIERDASGNVTRLLGAMSNITERKRAEEALLRSEALLTEAQRIGHVGHILWKSTSNEMICSNELYDILALPRGTALSRQDLIDMMPTEDKERLKELDKDAFSRRDNLDYEYRIHLANGAERWLHQQGKITYDENGIPIQMLAVVQDITERKLAENSEREQRILAEALRDTAEMLNSTLDYGEVLDHILSAAGRVVPHDAACIMLIENGIAHVARARGYEKRGFHTEVMEMKLSLTEAGNLQQMSETRQPLVVSETSTYPGWKIMHHTEWLHSNVGAPIFIQSELVGFILLDGETPGFFTPVHAERLQAFASQAALAIQNARLLKQAQDEIVERRQAEEELRQSESRYRTVVENQTEFIVRWKPDGTRMFVNDAYCRYFGITPEQAISTDFMPLIYEEDRAAVERKIKRLVSGTIQTETDIHRVIKADGSIGWQEWTEQAIYDKDGQVSEFQSVGRDITERKKAESELRASEERFRQLADNIQETFWMTDAITGEEIYISPAAEKIWGHSIEELMTNPNSYLESIYPEDLPRVQESLKIQREGQPTSTEYRTLRPDGSICWVWDRAFPVFDENGKVVRLAGIAADITERKQAQDALRDSEERYRQLLSVAPIGVAVHVNGKIVFANAKGASIVGASSPEELIGKPIIDFVPQEDRPHTMSVIQRMMQGEQGLYPREERFVRIDGAIIHVEVIAVPINYMDSTAVQVIVQDITERKQVDETLRKNEQRLRIALAGTNIAVFNQDMDLRYTWMYQPQLGYTSEQVVGKTDAELLPQQDASYIMEIKRRALETGKPQRAETAIHSPDRTTHYDLIVEPLLDHDGTIIGITGSTLDITDHKNFELESRRHLAELEALYENGLAVGRLLNPREIGERIISTFARHLSWHHVTIRLIQPGSDTLDLIAFNLPGLSEEERPGVEQHFQSMISRVGQGLSGWVAQTGEAVRTGNVHAHSQYIDTLAGIQSGLYMPLKIGEQVLGVISVESEEPDAFTAQDERLLATLANQASIAFENARLYQSAQSEIAERKRAEKELRESQERYQLLVETSPDGIGMMDLQGNILFGNHQMAELFRVGDSAKLVGTNMISLVAPESQSEVMGYLGTPMPAGVIQEGLWLARNDGTRFFGEMRTSALRNEMGEQYAIIGQVRDVTEREQARLAVHEERQRFLDLFENSPVATWLEDFSAVIDWMNGLRAQGITNLKEYLEKNHEAYILGVTLIKILDVNHAAVMMNGARDKAELLVKVHELMMDDTPSQVMIHEMELIWRGYTSFGFEMSSQKLDGTLITGVQRIYIPVINNEPDYTRVIATNTDITDRVNIENKLRTSEVHYRELADSITDIFFELDQELHFSHWNKASENLTSFSADFAMGKSMAEVFGQSSGVDRLEKVFQVVRENHQPKTFEVTIPLRHQLRTFEINAYPSTRGVAVVAKDITERKLSESLMQKRFELMEYSAEHNLEESMQKVLDEISEWTHSTIAFFQTIQEDQVTPNMQVWSTDTFKHFHTSQVEEMHKPADQAGVWAEAIRQRRAIIHNDYASLAGKKGMPESHAALVREMVVPIIRNERIVAVIGIGNKAQEYTRDDLEIMERFADYAWDVIERKQMVTELAEERNQLARRVEERTSDLSRANSNLARALRVKDEFLASMSHELRTPLNAILGLSESLGEQIAGPLNEKQQKYLNTISESGHHLLSLINDILDLAKIEAGQITLEINKVDVSLVSQSSLRMIKQLAQKKNLDVLVEIDEAIGLMWADERRLKQMMVNLLSNAVKFTPEGGKIGLQIQGNQEDNKVTITIWDTGIGIKEGDFQRLFQPFVQLDSGLAREATGTGLGLALVAQMARLHGGSVNVTSELGKGSRFTIVLPWKPAQAMTIVEKMRVTGRLRTTKEENGQQTILLVEDTQEVVMMIKDYLEIAGYKVVTAQDGLDGITQAKISHPNLILMDVQMPRMDGLEATQKLRQDPEFKHTPIIALTALAMPNDRERCIAAGMDEYLSKPVNLRSLVRTIQSCLSIREERTLPR